MCQSDCCPIKCLTCSVALGWYKDRTVQNTSDLSLISNEGGLALAVTMIDGSVLYQGVDGAWQTQRNMAGDVQTQPCSCWQ